FGDKNSRAEYIAAIAKWVGKLRATVLKWQACWNESTQKLPPRLYFKENSTTIYDSRSGATVEYSVGETGKAILGHLSRPTRIDDLTKVFSALEGVDVAKQIALLQEKRLVFQEGDRLLSVVMYGEHGSGRAQYAPHQMPVVEPVRVPVATASSLVQI